MFSIVADVDAVAHEDADDGNSQVVIIAFAPVLTVDVSATAVAAISFFYH